MTAMTSWAITVLGVLGLVLMLNQLGVNAGGDIGTMLRGVEHLLGQPLL